MGVNLAGPDRETAVDRVVGALMERERVLAGGVHEKVGLKLLAVNWLVGAQALGGAGGRVFTGGSLLVTAALGGSGLVGFCGCHSGRRTACS